MQLSMQWLVSCVPFFVLFWVRCEELGTILTTMINLYTVTYWIKKILLKFCVKIPNNSHNTEVFLIPFYSFHSN